jgi:hypothetical protein
MKHQIAKATKTISAPAAAIYEIIADYRTNHARILPKPYFLSLNVEKGGFGAGTIVNFEMRIFGQTQSFRSLITEPEPGRSLLEIDLNSGVSTRFDVTPLDDGATRVTISTESKNRGLVESYIAKLLLQKIYRQELDLLANLAGNRASPVHAERLNQVP